MKKSITTLLKATALTAVLGFSGVASAELVANVPLDSSRYEIMPANQLISQAKSGNQQAQFFLAKTLPKRYRYHTKLPTSRAMVHHRSQARHRTCTT